MFGRQSKKQRVYFKTAAGVVVTSAIAEITPLSSSYVGKQVAESDVVNTAIFIVDWNLVNVIQGHYIWTSTMESWLITGVKYRNANTEFVALRQAPAAAFAPTAAAGIVSEWAFKSSPGLLTDEQGRNNLTNVGTTVYNSDRPMPVNSELGSADFTRASSQRLEITDASQQMLDITGTLTFACWLKLKSLPSSAGEVFYIIGKDTGAAGGWTYHLYVSNSTDKIVFEGSPDGTALTVCRAGTTLAINTWYSVAIVHDGVDFRIYVNGALDTAADNPKSYSSGIFNGGAKFCLGGREDNLRFLNGRLAHVFVFNQAKTAGAISDWHSTDQWS